MEILTNPNVAYVLLAGGVFFATLSILSPGTGVMEIISLVMLILSGWAIVNIPINEWAILVLLLGLVLFFIAIRNPKRIIYLVISIVMLVVGSAFMFSTGEQWVPAVEPLLALVVSLFMGAFFWFAAQKVLETRSMRPTHDLDALLGKEGVARSEILDEGSVQVAGELWTAQSRKRIMDGTPVKVIGRDGFMLEVEALEQEE